VMTYSGNQVKSITDANGSQGLYNVKEYQNKANTTNEMSYDKNGNMVKDLDREIVTIRYNILNLPDTIQFKYGNQIINRYAADGRKLYTEYFTKLIQLATPIDTGGVYSWVYDRNLYNLKGNDYVGNMEYSIAVKPAGTKTHSLLRVHNPEGYSDNFNNSFMSTYFYYFRRDHLGNTREVWRAPFIVYAYGNRTDPASVVQRTQYYPSGLPWSEGLASDWQPYKYNGKEFVEMNALDETDLGNRGVHHAKMRFDTMDRFAEKYPWQSPYCFAGNNPVNNIDVLGDSATFQGSGAQNAVNFLNTQLAGFYTFNLNSKTGLVSMTAVLQQNGTQQPQMNTEQKQFASQLNNIFNGNGMTNINVVNNDNNVLIGDVKTQTMDIGDIQQFGTGEWVDQIGAFIHEASEQYNVQVVNKGQQTIPLNLRAHGAATRTESITTGNAYDPSRIVSGPINGNGSITVPVRDPSTGQVHNVFVNYQNGNVTSITR